MEIDADQSTFLSGIIRKWGRLPLSLLGAYDVQHHRYGMIGWKDWSMYPIIRPGSLVVIDERRRRVAERGWSDEFDRPIYFVEHRGGYSCGWCAVSGEALVVQPHPSSTVPPQVFQLSSVDILGQVIAAAVPLEGRSRPQERGLIST
jgi:hypothetical protein